MSLEYNTLCFKFNQDTKLLKIANTNTDLEELLKQALMGDKASFLVFLDLLEETRPKARKFLNLKELYALFTQLKTICPNVIKIEFGSVIFEVPTFGNFRLITEFTHGRGNDNYIKYDDYQCQIDERCWFNPSIIINGKEVNQIVNDEGYCRACNYQGTIPGLNSDQHPKVKEIFQLCNEKAKNDWHALEEIFLQN